MWVCLVCLLLCKEEGSSPVYLQLLGGGIWACMRCLCLCLCLVCVRYVWYYVGVKCSFQHAREEVLLILNLQLMMEVWLKGYKQVCGLTKGPPRHKETWW